MGSLKTLFGLWMGESYGVLFLMIGVLVFFAVLPMGAEYKWPWYVTVLVEAGVVIVMSGIYALCDKLGLGDTYLDQIQRKDN